ncbi:MAG: EboA domain-containing protein [Streptosporangiales bacterium]|nr:EboA domain-containing protein [Streptosporangiales bacterium]MBO0890141.1 EboA domain-containing protein [Acidothermales bacterium]
MSLDTVLAERLSDDGRRWLDAATDRVRSDAAAIRVLFPAVGRNVGRGAVEDAARVALLKAVPSRGPALVDEVAALYRFGDAAEKRGVLRALHLLDVGDRGLPIVQDALRTNDTRLVAAALGPYGAAQLDAAAYRQGVLKCVFVGVPLADIEGLERRADAELARMLADFATERLAAGRDVPGDVWLVLDRFPDAATGLRKTAEEA